MSTVSLQHTVDVDEFDQHIWPSLVPLILELLPAPRVEFWGGYESGHNTSPLSQSQLEQLQFYVEIVCSNRLQRLLLSAIHEILGSHCVALLQVAEEQIELTAGSSSELALQRFLQVFESYVNHIQQLANLFRGLVRFCDEARSYSLNFVLS